MSDEILTGLISAEHDPPGLDRARWGALIDGNPALDRTSEDAAKILIEGAPVGRMAWSERGHEIEVYGELERVQDLAWEVASALDGGFVTLAELTRC